MIARNPDRKSVEILAEFADEVKLDVYRAPTDKAEAEYVVHQIEQMVGGTSYFSLDSGRVDGDDAGRGALLRRLRRALPAERAEPPPGRGVRPLRHPLPDGGADAAHQPQGGARGAGASVAAVQSAVTGACRAGCQPVLHPASPAELARARQAGAPVARLIEQIMAQIAAAAQAVRRRRRSAPASAHPARGAVRGSPGRLSGATALQSETDAYDPRADRVTLMSLHASKGLEFPVVFIVGCEEGLLPYERKGEAVDVEEERRLFYVGLTRAGRKLVLTHARKRVLFGQFMENPPSRFVGDIEAALKEVQERKYRPPEREAGERAVEPVLMLTLQINSV